MRQLYHLAIDPGCRSIRVMLAEKDLDCELKTEKIWERREVFLRLNPAGQVPVFIDDDGTAIPGTAVISEYLEEAYPEPTLLGATPLDRAETRRLAGWFSDKFHDECCRLGVKLARLILRDVDTFEGAILDAREAQAERQTESQRRVGAAQA